MRLSILFSQVPYDVHELARQVAAALGAQEAFGVSGGDEFMCVAQTDMYSICVYIYVHIYVHIYIYIDIDR